jgi:hypothetical protein
MDFLLRLVWLFLAHPTGGWAAKGAAKNCSHSPHTSIRAGLFGRICGRKREESRGHRHTPLCFAVIGVLMGRCLAWVRQFTNAGAARTRRPAYAVISEVGFTDFSLSECPSKSADPIALGSASTLEKESVSLLVRRKLRDPRPGRSIPEPEDPILSTGKQRESVTRCSQRVHERRVFRHGPHNGAVGAHHPHLSIA